MQPVHHQLTRSETDKRIAGVCGGLAEYFDIDPIIVRIAFVASIFFGGLGILLYIVLWIVMPRGTPGVPGQRTAGRGSSAIRIAEERFARGEITAQELAQIRADLTGRS
jgi:phage shock protein PspC (stress-responsive transcriptional regulator)